MNPFMTSFVIMGAIYVLIGLWSLVMGFMPSLGIAVSGMVLCFLGWKYSRDHLQ